MNFIAPVAPLTKLKALPVMILVDQGAARRIWAALHMKAAGYQWCAICGKGARTRKAIQHKRGCAVQKLGERL